VNSHNIAAEIIRDWQPGMLKICFTFKNSKFQRKSESAAATSFYILLNIAKNRPILPKRLEQAPIPDATQLPDVLEWPCGQETGQQGT